jgi:C-terminal processing protease CtpA/Prc
MNSEGISVSKVACNLSILILLCITACTATPQPSGLAPLESAPTLGITIDKDAVVIDVEPGNSAERAGIQIGDAIQNVGSLSLNSAEVRADLSKAREVRMQVKSMLMSAKPGEMISVKVRRTSGDVDVNVQLMAPRFRMGEPTATPVVDPNFYL